MPNSIRRWSYRVPLWQKLALVYGIPFLIILGWMFIEPIELQAVKVKEEILSEKARYVLVTDVYIEKELHTIDYLDGYLFWFIPIERRVLLVTDVEVQPNDMILLNRIDIKTICDYYNQNTEKVEPTKFIKVEYKTDFYGYCGESYYYEILE